MAKKITKKINAGFNPTYFDPYQYGFGSWLGKNAGMIGTVAGGIGGTFLGNPVLGAKIGGTLGGAVQEGQDDTQTQLLRQQQQEALKRDMISNLPSNFNYKPTFQDGGPIDAITGQTINVKRILGDNKKLGDFGKARGYLEDAPDNKYKRIPGQERKIPPTNKNDFANEFLNYYLNDPKSKDKLKKTLNLDDKTAQEYLDNMKKNINSIYHADPRYLPGNTITNGISAFYSGKSHATVSPERYAVHETMHGSNAVPYPEQDNDIADAIRKIISTDSSIKDKKADSYFHSPAELYPRLMQWRFNNKIRPGDVLTPEKVKELRGPHDDQLNYLDDETIAELHNKLAYNENYNNKDIMAKGGKIPENYNNAWTQFNQLQPEYTKALANKYPNIPIRDILSESVKDTTFRNTKVNDYASDLINQYGDFYLNDAEMDSIANAQGADIRDMERVLSKYDYKDNNKYVRTKGAKEADQTDYKFGPRMMLHRRFDAGETPYKFLEEEQYAKGGGIKIDPSKKGTFKAQADKMGMSVQEAASKILNAPEGKYSAEMRKKANFAKNFAKAGGGFITNDLLPTYAGGGLMTTGTVNQDNTSEFKGGGTHEVNPLGGIPVGPNALVEDGEVKFDVEGGESYIFSNRIPYNKKK